MYISLVTIGKGIPVMFVLLLALRTQAPEKILWYVPSASAVKETKRS